MPQQAKTESSAARRNFFVLSLSDQKGIACQRRVRFIKKCIDVFYDAHTIDLFILWWYTKMQNIVTTCRKIREG